MFQTGNKLRVQVFGQSHSPQIGVVMDGFPSGVAVDEERLAAFMERRAPGRNALSTSRKEADRAEFLSGVVNGFTTGAPICASIANRDTRSADYEQLRFTPRPGHADYPAFVKYGEYRDHRGGGEFSGRLTAPLCIAGFLCMELLRQRNIEIGAHIASVGTVCDDRFSPVLLSSEQLHTAAKKPFPVLNTEKGLLMQEEIRKAAADADSVGGTVECAVTGLPAGCGDSAFGSIESKLSSALFAIPAVKGIEFGSGFAGSEKRGSENNDPFRTDGTDVCTLTNNAGGILGGIATGMPVVFRLAFKPTPSIGKEQDSVSLSEHRNVRLKIVGRHDPCIVQRAVPVVEAVTAIAVLDMIL